MRQDVVAFRARRTRTLGRCSFDARSRRQTTSASESGSGVKVGSIKLLLLGVLLSAPVTLMAESPSVIEVAKFSSGTVGQAMPDGWKPLTF